MAHYAYLDDNNIVVTITIGKNENELIDGLDTETYYALNTPYTVKRTSYNTHGGVHYGSNGQPDGGVAFRKNYAGIGYGFDGIGFFAPSPYPSWILDSETYYWQAPVPYPADGKYYYWDEATLSWVEIQP